MNRPRAHSQALGRCPHAASRKTLRSIAPHTHRAARGAGGRESSSHERTYRITLRLDRARSQALRTHPHLAEHRS
jgi:hypothetical protein